MLRGIKPGCRECVLIHCTLGKDRTGMVFALLFLLAGVSDTVIASEYGLSTEGLAGCVDSIESYLNHATENRDDARKKPKRSLLPSLFLHICEFDQSSDSKSREENMIARIKGIRDEYGTAENYFLRERGLSDEDLRCSRSILLAGDDLNIPTAKGGRSQQSAFT